MVSFLRPRSAELAVGVAYRLIGGGRGGPGGMPRGAPNPSEEKKEGIFVQRFQTPAQYGTELYPVQYSTQVQYPVRAYEQYPYSTVPGSATGTDVPTV